MTKREENLQQMLELIYGLLPDEESAALSTRIGQDPDLARSYAELKQKTEMLGEVVKAESVAAPNYSLWKKLAEQPDPVGTAVGSLHDHEAANTSLADSASQSSQGSKKFQDYKQTTFYRYSAVTLKTMAVLAASVLIFFTGFQYLRPDSLLTVKGQNYRAMRAAADELALNVSAPAILSKGIDNEIQIEVSNLVKEPVSAELEMVLTDFSGTEVYRSDHLVERGLLNCSIPSETLTDSLDNTSYSLSVKAKNSQSVSTLQFPVTAVAQPQLTTLTTDRPVVNQGEQLRVRSVTLDAISKEVPPGPTEVEYAIEDLQGNNIQALTKRESTVRGVAAEEFEIPEILQRGRYRLKAKSLNQNVAYDLLYFDIETEEKPQWVADLDYEDRWYQPGDQVNVKVQLKSPQGLPIANQKIQAQPVISGEYDTSQIQAVRTSERGEAELQFALPGKLSANGQNQLFLFDEQNQWGYVQEIPVAKQQVEVHFYPEGGKLVPGFENRVYFQAFDQQQQPVDLGGTIIDQNGDAVADVKTLVNGRGYFKLKPQSPDSRYQLQLATSPANTSTIDLPPLAAKAPATLQVKNTVSQQDEKIQIAVGSNYANQRLGIIAFNNGVPVSQYFWNTNAQAPSNEEVELDLPEPVAGVSRLTLYKSEGEDVIPVAERLVYRKPQKVINLEVESLQTEYPVGKEVELDISTADENGNPLDAVLGISVVSESAFARQQDTGWALDSKQFIGQQLAKSDEIVDARSLIEKSKNLGDLGESRESQTLSRTDSQQVAQQSSLERFDNDQLPEDNRSGLISNNFSNFESDNITFENSNDIDPDQQLDLYLGTDGWTLIDLLEDGSEIDELYAANSNRDIVDENELNLAKNLNLRADRSRLGLSGAYSDELTPVTGIEVKDYSNVESAHESHRQKVAQFELESQKIRQTLYSTSVICISIIGVSLLGLYLLNFINQAWVWVPLAAAAAVCFVAVVFAPYWFSDRLQSDSSLMLVMSNSAKTDSMQTDNETTAWKHDEAPLAEPSNNAKNQRKTLTLQSGSDSFNTTASEEKPAVEFAPAMTAPKDGSIPNSSNTPKPESDPFEPSNRESRNLKRDFEDSIKMNALKSNITKNIPQDKLGEEAKESRPLEDATFPNKSETANGGFAGGNVKEAAIPETPKGVASEMISNLTKKPTSTASQPTTENRKKTIPDSQNLANPRSNKQAISESDTTSDFFKNNSMSKIKNSPADNNADEISTNTQQTLFRWQICHNLGQVFCLDRVQSQRRIMILQNIVIK